MRLVSRKGLLTAAAAGGVLAVTSGTAFADAGAEGAALGSPGLLSGNNIQAPLHVPLNLCGNTVNVVGALNPAQGNQCANVDDGRRSGHGARAEGTAADSPGILSGNNVQAPIEVPVNACGNSVDVVGVGNPAQGNRCGNVSPGGKEERPEDPKESKPEEPGEKDDPATPSDPETTASQEESQLAETGSDATLLAAVPVSAALLLGGAMLYRRSRAAGRR